MFDMLKSCKIVQATNPTSSLAAATASKVVDMAGFDSCLFINLIGATSGPVTMIAQMASSTSDGDFAALTNATVGPTTVGNGTLVIDVHKPTKRYLRVTVESTGASNVNGGVIAIAYNAHACPTSNASSDVIDSTTIVST